MSNKQWNCHVAIESQSKSKKCKAIYYAQGAIISTLAYKVSGEEQVLMHNAIIYCFTCALVDNFSPPDLESILLIDSTKTP